MAEPLEAKENKPHPQNDKDRRFHRSSNTRSELFEWLSGVLGWQIVKLEQLQSGAVYCLLLDAYESGAVPIHKVNLAARFEYEFGSNYKALQAAFDAANIQKPVDWERLMTTTQPHLELLQWLKDHYSSRQPLPARQPLQRRRLCKHGDISELPMPTAAHRPLKMQSAGSGSAGGRATGSGGPLQPVNGPPLRNVRSKAGSTETMPRAQSGTGSFSTPRAPRVQGRPPRSPASPVPPAGVCGPAARGNRAPPALSGRPEEGLVGSNLLATSIAEDGVDENGELHHDTASCSSDGDPAGRTHSPASVLDTTTSNAATEAELSKALAQHAHTMPGSRPSSFSTAASSLNAAQRAGQRWLAPPGTQSAGATPRISIGGIEQEVQPLSPHRAQRLSAASKRVSRADEAAHQAVTVVRASLPELRRLLKDVGSTTRDGYLHRGKLRSRRGMTSMMINHTSALLQDLLQLSLLQGPEGRARARRTESLMKDLAAASAAFVDLCDEIDKAERFFKVPAAAVAKLAADRQAAANKGVSDTRQLDAAMRSVGHAQTSLGSVWAGVGPVQRWSHASGPMLAVPRGFIPSRAASEASDASDHPDSDGYSDFDDGVSSSAGSALEKLTWQAQEAEQPLTEAALTARSAQSRGRSPHYASSEATSAGDAPDSTYAETAGGAHAPTSAAAASPASTSGAVHDAAQADAPAGVLFVAQEAGSAEKGVDYDRVFKVPSLHPEHLSPRSTTDAEAATPSASAASPPQQAQQQPAPATPAGAADGNESGISPAKSSRSGLGKLMSKLSPRRMMAKASPEKPSTSPAQAQQPGSPAQPAQPSTPSTGTGSTACQNGAASSEYSRRLLTLLESGQYEQRAMSNGDVYKGTYAAGVKSGEGVYGFANGDVYEGEFRDDCMHGVGVYSFANQGRYEGEWEQAQYSGMGMETFARGSTYHGGYKAGARHGFGVCRYYNGDYYEGRWSEGLRDGRGMQQCTDDSNYVGDYERGKRHGYGAYSFPNSDRYMGQYAEDVPHGHGVYQFASGQTYEGQWAAGKKHGWCIYTVESGEQWAGKWGAGKPKWVEKLHQTEAVELPDSNAEAMDLCLEAARTAREAGKEGAARADSHWQTDGNMQAAIREAVEAAKGRADAAQAARQRAASLAAAMAQIIDFHQHGLELSAAKGGAQPAAVQEARAKTES